MFGRRPEGGGRRPDAKGRAGVYALCALYLGYLLYQLLSPLLTGAGELPPRTALLLGIPVLGGGMAALLVLAWRVYRAPAPRDGEEPPEIPGQEDEDPYSNHQKR